MERHRVAGRRDPRHPVRRWARELLLAVLLTVAAAAFITAALLRGNDSQLGAPAFETARKPPTN